MHPFKGTAINDHLGNLTAGPLRSPPEKSHLDASQIRNQGGVQAPAVPQGENTHIW